jgi:hypothetical protein
MYYKKYYNSPIKNRNNELFLIERYDESGFILIKKINTARTVNYIFGLSNQFNGIFD